MGIYIGNSTNPVTVEFVGGSVSTEAYLGLTDSYGPIIKKGDNYVCKVGVEGWLSKALKDAGERSVQIKGFSIVEISFTNTEFVTALGTDSIFSFFLGKLIPQLGVLIPAWAGKLIADF